MISTATLSGGLVKFTLPYNMSVAVQDMPGRVWEPYQKCYYAPATQETIRHLISIPSIRIDETLEHLIPKQDEFPAADVSMPEQPIRPMPIKGVTPFAHQVRAYNLGITNPGVALLMEMGTGKTLTAIAITGRRAIDDGVKRVLVVCPVSVVPVWGREIKEYLGIPANVITLEGTGAKKAKQLSEHGSGLQIAVSNYESIWREPLASAIEDFNPQLIVADESQRIKNPKAKQAKAMHALGAKAPFGLILSGTPVMNSPLDLWSQYRVIAPHIFDRSFYAFKTRYAVMGGFEGRQVVAYRNLDDLTQKAHSVASRVTKADALDLPGELSQELYCELEPSSRRIYKQLQREMAAELDNEKVVTAQHVITRMLRLSQITGGFVNADVDNGQESVQVSEVKLKLLTETMKDVIDSGKKVVVFARFRAEIEAIDKVAESLVGRESVRKIWGDTKLAYRGEYVNDFQNDPNVRVFIAQIATAGLGITLTAADTAIFYSLDYSYANHAQAKARIHRIGQRNTCTYIYLIARQTIDSEVLNALRQKADLARLVVDDWRRLLLSQPNEHIVQK